MEADKESYMIPIYQTEFNDTTTCMQAAIASMLHLTVEEVPVFLDTEEPILAYSNFVEFMDSQNYVSVGFYSTGVIDDIYKQLSEAPTINGCIYAVVESRDPRHVYHAVLINSKGVVIHDPDPKKSFLGVDVVESKELSYWERFACKEPNSLQYNRNKSYLP